MVCSGSKSMNQRLLLFILLLFCTFTFGGCADKYGVQMRESAQELEVILRMNVDHPEKLLTELDAYIVKYQPLWDRTKHILENRSDESVSREISTQLRYLDESFKNILDLDLEIQDTLQDRPELLRAYQERVRRIGKPGA